ncbi:hypothetical protein An02g07200 [Aspergillus niger]|uniref:Uncharacterized protein n=2 Tax=Aspergillus niger TaxID=5061 RepID=A2QDI3_ASPNC|nr:hypothetical protein An02g07200 [Aspergillus niger]CAK37684.1 hypothetical protein An02g07200 [Aspergillus niger]
MMDWAKRLNDARKSDAGDLEPGGAGCGATCQVAANGWPARLRHLARGSSRVIAPELSGRSPCYLRPYRDGRITRIRARVMM